MTQVLEYRSLSNVRVNKDTLLEKIRLNREEHRRIFEEALEGWKESVTQQLQEMYEDAKAGRKYRLQVGQRRPEDHTKDYDAVITMLEMSEDDELVLSNQEFRTYALDEWGWQTDFLVSNTRYSRSAIDKAESMGYTGDQL